MKEIIGRKIVECRRMSSQELLDEGWQDKERDTPFVLVLDDGMKIYPSRDEEGNGPGALFGTKDGNMYMID